MKFKLDENLPLELATDLRGLGHIADTVTDENLQGAADSAVMEAANADGRILLTLDKGIANLKRYPIVATDSGVVLFRPGLLGRRAVLSFVRQHLHKALELELNGRLTVVSPNRIRFR